MSRYGWQSPRGGLSPFASQTNSEDGPHVSDDDFSYITSEDLGESLQTTERAHDSHSRRAQRNPVVEEDDVILIKFKSVSHPVHFPPYSISEGKLTVRDIRDRAGLLMGLSNRRADRIKMYYKGQNLKELDVPIREYGVKNNSELLVVVPEGRQSDDESSSAHEDAQVADPRDEARTTRKKKNKNGKKKPKSRGPKDAPTNLGVPQVDGDKRRTGSDPYSNPSQGASPAAPQGAVEKLDAIRSYFDTNLMPLCRDFLRHPPTDPKKLQDEHRKISETVMMHVILKLDEIDTGGDLDIRARRKDLVNYVQGTLNDMDSVKANR